LQDEEEYSFENFPEEFRDLFLPVSVCLIDLISRPRVISDKSEYWGDKKFTQAVKKQDLRSFQ
jgi:hypothetical protein